jgi:hypothetical protein
MGSFHIFYSSLQYVASAKRYFVKASITTKKYQLEFLAPMGPHLSFGENVAIAGCIGNSLLMGVFDYI